MNIKDENIIKNLFLTVDFEKGQTESGIVTGQDKVYLIGGLPVLVKYRNGKKLVSKIVTRTILPLGSPNIKKLFGAKANDPVIFQTYRKPIKELSAKLIKSLKKVSESGLFAGERVDGIMIMNFN